MSDPQNHQVDGAVARLKDGDGSASAELFARHRDRLRRMVDMRLDHRVAGRVDPSDGFRETYRDASSQLDGYLAKLPMSPFVWLGFLTGQRRIVTGRRGSPVARWDSPQLLAMDAVIGGGRQHRVP